MKAAAATMDSEPTMVPTAIPAMAPVVNPLADEPDKVEPLAVEAAEVAVVVTVESKSSADTLKQGTETPKSAASTKYYCKVSLEMRREMDGNQAHNICAGVERLVFAIVLIVVICPVLELDGRVGPGSDTAGDGADLVALVARLDLGHVANNLLSEVALLGGVYTS